MKLKNYSDGKIIKNSDYWLAVIDANTESKASVSPHRHIENIALNILNYITMCLIFNVQRTFNIIIGIRLVFFKGLGLNTFYYTLSPLNHTV
jgi:hypothetical protein